MKKQIRDLYQSTQKLKNVRIQYMTMPLLKEIQKQIIRIEENKKTAWQQLSGVLSIDFSTKWQIICTKKI